MNLFKIIDYCKKRVDCNCKVIVPMLLFLVLSVNGFAQATKNITINNTNISIKDLFREIEKQSGLTFFYNNADIDIEKKVSVNATNKTVDSVLKDVLPATLAAEISGNKITIVKKTVQQPTQQNQTKNLTGKITDESGMGLPGATVLIEGTTNGTVSGPDGTYVLENVPATGTLKFTFIGFVSQTIPVEGKVKIDVVLVEETKAIDEVVVIGYGTQKKSNVTGAISSVKSSDLENRSVANAASAIQGKSAGVQVMNTSGAPGKTPSVRIRGYSSNGTSDPLYIVDGLKVTDINYLNVENIENIEILKDGASAAIYGAEAGNGVVLITTKTGKKGEGKMFYNGSYAISNLSKRLDVLNATDYVQYLREIGVSQDLLDAYYFENPSSYVNNKPADTDWQDVMFTQGINQRHTLGFQGGNERGSLYTSLSYLDNDGIVVGPQDSYSRITGQINGTYKVRDWIEVGVNNSIETSELKQTSESDIVHGATVSNIYGIDPLTPVEYSDGLLGVSSNVQNAVEDGHFPLINPETGNYYGSTYWSILNPMSTKNRVNTYSEVFNINGTAYVNLKPFKGFVFTSRLGYRFGNSYNYSYTPPYWLKADDTNDAQQLSASQTGSLYYQWENFGTYNFAIKKHEFSVLGGMSFIHSKANMVSGNTDKTTNLADNFLYLNYSASDANDGVGGTTLERAQLAYYGRLSWNYENRYYLQFNFRADAYDTSKLDIDHAWGYFPSVSGGWTLSNENFMKDMNRDALSYLKIRASYGKNGSISNLANYMYASSLVPGTLYYFMAEQPVSQINPSTALANPELKWEESIQSDFGIDLRFLKDRLGFTADYYNKNTEGMLIQSTANLTTGASTVFQNVGKVNNHGFEFDLEWKDRIGDDFTYDIKGNLGTVSNKVTEYKGEGTRIEGDDVNRTGIFVTAFEEGYPVWYLHGYKCAGIDETNGMPIIEDISKDGKITSDDKTYIGDGIPDFTYGATVSANYKNFDFLVYGAGSSGADIMYDALMANVTVPINQPHFMFDDRWTPENTAGTRPSSLYQFTNEYLASDAVVFNGSYFKIKQIQLGYSIPASVLNKVKVSTLRLYVSLEDFFTFTSYPGLDPEVRWNTTYNMALDGGGYPVPKSVMFGVNLAF